MRSPVVRRRSGRLAGDSVGVARPGARAGVFASLQGLAVGPGDGFALRASVTQALDAHTAHVRQQRSGPDALAAPGANVAEDVPKP